MGRSVIVEFSQSSTTSSKPFWKYFFSPEKLYQAGPADIKIAIELDHFQATDTSKVVAAGNYSIFNKNDKQNITIKPFYHELELAKDGYAHSVLQLRNLVSLLAKQIEADSLELLK